MIRGETFVFLGLEDWQGLWRSTQSLSKNRRGSGRQGV